LGRIAVLVVTVAVAPNSTIIISVPALVMRIVMGIWTVGLNVGVTVALDPVNEAVPPAPDALAGLKISNFISVSSFGF
jgi:hypothetical protein